VMDGWVTPSGLRPHSPTKWGRDLPIKGLRILKRWVRVRDARQDRCGPRLAGRGGISLPTRGEPDARRARPLCRRRRALPRGRSRGMRPRPGGRTLGRRSRADPGTGRIGQTGRGLISLQPISGLWGSTDQEIFVTGCLTQRVIVRR